MPDLSELLQAATPREVTVPVCLAGDASGDLEALEEELAQVSDWQPTSLGETNPAAALREQIDAARQRVREATVHFRFRALGHRAYSALIVAHPAPKDAPAETLWDPNTFLPALLAACCVEPALTAAQVDRLLDVVNEGTAQALFAAAIAVNEELSPVPFSSPA